MKKENVKNLVNKETVKKLASRKYIPWVIAIVLACLFFNVFNLASNDYCAQKEIIDVVGDLAEDRIGAKITNKGAKKIARDGKIYYCEAPIVNKEGRTLKYTLHILDEGFWTELGHNFK